jgi:hypothetical protein
MLSLRSLPRLALLVGVGSLLWAPGCGKQGEGERCDKQRNNDTDCEAGLVCTRADDLVDKSQNAADRCCPPEGETITDDRCQRSTGTGGSGGTDAGTDSSSGGQSGASGSSGTAGAAGAAGSGGTSGSGGSGGVSGGGGTGGSGVECTYSSQCDGDQICGPTGVCQPECAGDGGKDCLAGEVCVNGSCVALDGG